MACEKSVRTLIKMMDLSPFIDFYYYKSFQELMSDSLSEQRQVISYEEIIVKINECKFGLIRMIEVT